MDIKASKRRVPTELMPMVLKTYGNILIRNQEADEVAVWNTAAQLVWLSQLADTQLLMQQLISTSK